MCFYFSNPLYTSLTMTSVSAILHLRWLDRYFGYSVCASLLCGSCQCVTLSVLCVCRRVGFPECVLWFYQQICLIMIMSGIKAGSFSRNPNLHVVITHASHVCSQHSFGLPLRMNGMHRTQFDHARLDLLSLVI